MKRKISFFLIGLSFLPINSARSQSEGSLFRGLIGTSPVIMEFWSNPASDWDKKSGHDDSTCYGRYFYLSSLSDTKLQGIVKNGEFVLEVRRWTRSSEDSTVERFKLHKSNAGFQGEWAGSGKTLPVKLEKMSATSIKNPYDGYPAVDTMRNNEPFDYLKTSFLVLKRDSMRVYQARNVQWLSFEQSNVSMIEITSGYDSTALQKINHKLIDVMIQEARNELSCTGPDGELGDYQESVQGFFFGKNVLSVSVFVNFTCDGPHPDFGTESYNFNGHTGDELELTDITTFGDPALAVHNGTRDYDYYEELGERMVTILERLYPKEMNGNDTTDHEDDGCDYSTPDQWAYASWSFSDRGIMLSPSIAHVSAPCRDPDWPLLPYRYLNKHRNPKLKIKIP